MTEITLPLSDAHRRLLKSLKNNPKKLYIDRFAYEILHRIDKGETPTVAAIAEYVLQHPDSWMPKEGNEQVIFEAVIQTVVDALQGDNPEDAIRRLGQATG
ncbi:MAG TPA: hypothetical protein VJ841_00320 [Candidatus Saccharimonadales bacterium]|nr:hypothetical protein [Candidatus Saccharimonadales bacterium]